MKRTTPGYIKLLGHTRNSWDILGVGDIRTASSIFMTKEERKSLESAMDFRALAIDTRREMDKFAHQDAAVEKFQKNYFKARERLAGRINKNRALMELRHELQKRRRQRQAQGGGILKAESPDPQGTNPEESNPVTSQIGFNVVELRY